MLISRRVGRNAELSEETLVSSYTILHSFSPSFIQYTLIKHMAGASLALLELGVHGHSSYFPAIWRTVKETIRKYSYINSDSLTYQCCIYSPLCIHLQERTWRSSWKRRLAYQLKLPHCISECLVSSLVQLLTSVCIQCRSWIEGDGSSSWIPGTHMGWRDYVPSFQLQGFPSPGCCGYLGNT